MHGELQRLLHVEEEFILTKTISNKFSLENDHIQLISN